jgi:hypothetical protein
MEQKISSAAFLPPARFLSCACAERSLLLFRFHTMN